MLSYFVALIHYTCAHAHTCTHTQRCDLFIRHVHTHIHALTHRGVKIKGRVHKKKGVSRSVTVGVKIIDVDREISKRKTPKLKHVLVYWCSKRRLADNNADNDAFHTSN